MQDAITAFIDHMRAVGCSPSGVTIEADDKPHRYHIEGDKPRAMNGSYKLKVEPDGFAVGWCMSFREGINHGWHIKATRQYSPEDRALWKAKAAKAKADRQSEAERLAAQAADKAKRLWKAAETTGEAGYLARKGLSSLFGARVSRGMVVVPCWVSGALSGLQFIAAGGQKRFLRDGAMVGAYHAIVGDETMIICEGFATGAKISLATGHSVVCAFNAGNLKAVAVYMRAKYPDRRIMIGADNDQWTAKPDGTPYNPGMEGAKAAAVAIGGAMVVAPQVPDADPDKRTDWDDVFATDGADAVKEAFARAMVQPPEPEPDQQPDYQGEWEPDYEPQEQLQHVVEDALPVRAMGRDGNKYVLFAKRSGALFRMTASELCSVPGLSRIAMMENWKAAMGDPKAADKQVAAMAGAALLAASDAAGVWSDDKVRGIGLWIDGGRRVSHLGDSLLIDGRAVRPYDHQGRYVYEAGQRAITLGDEGLTNSEAAKLREICRSATWDSPLSGDMLAGYIPAAIACAALRWRPHVWITGDSGSGKSTVMDSIVKALLGDMAIEGSGMTTEAGLRQEMKRSARPVVFDEAESEGAKAKERMENVLQLARLSSSGGKVIKGTAGGEGSVSFTARSCFIFAAINPSIKNLADENRITILTLVRDIRPGADDRFAALMRLIAETITPEYSARMARRVYDNLHVLLANIDMFVRALHGVLKSKRDCDQIAPMLAGLFLLTSEKEISLEQAREWCQKHSLALIKYTQPAEVSDQSRLLTRIMTHVTRVTGTSTVREDTVGSLIARAAAMDSDTAAKKHLGTMGIKVCDGSIIIANKSPVISRILADTEWTVWKRPLMGMQGAQAVGYTYFAAGFKEYGVSLPLSHVLDDVAPDEELPFEPEEFR